MAELDFALRYIFVYLIILRKWKCRNWVCYCQLLNFLKRICIECELAGFSAKKHLIEVEHGADRMMQHIKRVIPSLLFLI